MISLEKKFLFIHIPKTAGNSIQNILNIYSEDKIISEKKNQDGIDRFGIKNDKYDIEKHSTLTDYKKTLEKDVYDSLFKFSTIRNPWARMISYYFSPHRGNVKWNRNEFINLVNQAPTLGDYIKEYSLYDRMLSRVGFNSGHSSKRLDADVDFLIRFENLNADFKDLCKTLDIPFTPLPKTNVSIRKHFSKYYDRELVEIVQKKFREEIEFENYEFNYFS
jgi:hypothetical protein